MSGNNTNINKNPEDGLKAVLEKLTKNVSNLGLALGIKEDGVDMDTTNKDNDKKSMKPEREMTAEEKKAQRAAKAAEKKERARLAAEKKANKDNNPAQVKQTNENKSQKAVSSKNKQIKMDTSQNDADDTMKNTESNKTIQKEVKSLLKSKNQPTSGAMEVKFDLQSNTTHVTKPNLSDSESEEVLVNSTFPLDDASHLINIHPAFINLAVRCDKGLVYDLDQLCQEFIEAFEKFLPTCSENAVQKKIDSVEFENEFSKEMKLQLSHLTEKDRWPLPYALGNIVRQLKQHISKLNELNNSSRSNEEIINKKAESILDWFEEVKRNNFDLDYDTIESYFQSKIKNAKCILTYDWCPIVNKVLINTKKEYEDMQICFVDSEMNGRAMRHVDKFIENGYRCQYTDLKSIGFVIRNCSMVVLGCSAVLSNGCVVAPKGSIQLALTAQAYNIPVLVLSQTFKFIDKVQTYSRVALMGRENVELLPSTLVTAVVTEIRIIPPTSAPAVLKAKALDLN